MWYANPLIAQERVVQEILTLGRATNPFNLKPLQN